MPTRRASIRSPKKSRSISPATWSSPPTARATTATRARLAKRAEAYLKSTGLGDTAYFGPEPEFFIFDSVTWHVDMSGCCVKIESEEARMVHRTDRFRRRQLGAPRAGQGRLLSGAAHRLAAGHPQRHFAGAGGAGRRGRGVPPRSRRRGPVRNRHQVQQPGQARRLDADPQVHGAHGRPHLRQDGDLHAEADRRRQRFGHARAPVGVEGRPEPVRRQRLRRTVRVRAVLHRRRDQAREGAQRDHQPGHQFVQASGARVRGADQSRVFGAQSLGGVPHSVRQQSQGTPGRSALPRSDRESVPLLRRAA